MIDRWAQLGSHAPRMANFMSTASKQLIQKALDLAPQRQMPRLAPRSFQRWARKHRVPASGGNVILWPDTFNNYYKPETSQAALEVLTHAGFNVMAPQTHLCCGRPLYDFGMLDKAKRYLQRILQVLAQEIDAGLPIVVLEPSCASVFRDELRNLFPEDPRAHRLRQQTFLLSEFLQHHAPGYQPPQLSQKLLLHGHCHHKAIMKMTDEEALLRRMGAVPKGLDAGCCGMAGPSASPKINTQYPRQSANGCSCRR